MANRHDRQEDILTPAELNSFVHVIGAGGIGSWATLAIAKMGCKNIVLYDDDIVEDHNIASQFFKESQMGMLKTEAIYENVLEQTGVKIEIEPNESETSIQNGVIIMAIDSMEERIRLGEIYKDKDIFIIDGRMGGLQLEVYCAHSSRYLTTTVPPEDVSHDSCTARSINFNCLVIAGLMANYLRMFVKGMIKKDTGISFCFNNISLIKETFE